jgi:hypothetical protein
MKSKPQTVDALLDEPVDLALLIQHLDFSEENIIMADREQPGYFLEASRYRVKKLRSRIAKESALDSEKAKASLFFRSKKGKREGVTEAYIKEKVVLDPRVQKSRELYDRSLVYEEWAKLLLEAYRERGRAIKTLAELLGAEAFAQARVGHKEMELAGFEALKRAVKKKYPGRREEE